MKLLSLFGPSARRAMWVASLLGAVSGASTALLVAFANRLLRQSTPSRETLGQFIALSLLMTAATIGSRIMIQTLSEQAMKEFVTLLCKRVLATPLRGVEQIGASRLLAAFTSDSRSIGLAITAMPLALTNAAVMGASLVFMGFLSLRLLGATMALTAVGVAVVAALLFKANGEARRAIRERNELFEHFRGLTEGAKELKLNRRRRQGFLAMLGATSERFRRVQMEHHTFATLAMTAGQLLFFVLIGALPLLGRLAQTTSPETLSTYGLIILFSAGPISSLLSALPTIGQAVLAYDSIQALGIALTPDEAHAADDDEIEPLDRIELVRMSYSYTNEKGVARFSLGPINLTLRPGHIYFIVGGNGSGKTTLTKLIAGFYPPESGGIYLNGRRITEENVEDYRQYFSAIFTDFYLFSDLKLLGVEDVDRRARHYLVKLHLDHKVTVDGGTFSTTSLSTGQRKRLALLVAYLEDRPVYIFDEWAADQDPIYKRVFYEELLPELKARGKCILIISHDERYFGIADELIKLEDGQMLEEATYAFMNRLQGGDLGATAPPRRPAKVDEG